MQTYNKSINLDLRQKASKVLRHFFKELKRNRGNLNLMLAENEESLEFIATTADQNMTTGLVRITDLGIAVEVEVDVELVESVDPDTTRSLIRGHRNNVTVYETEDSDSPFYAEHYKALRGDFIRELTSKQETYHKMKNELQSIKRELETRLNTIRRNTAALVSKFGDECSEGTFTLTFNGNNPTWEGHSFYRIMVEDFGTSDYELRDMQDNYVSSNDLDCQFLIEIYEKVLAIVG